MPEGKAKTKYIRMAPKKVRLVIDLIKGKNLEEALNILHFSPKRACVAVEKAIRSAIANVISIEGSNKVDVNNYYVKSAEVNEGPVMRRFRPMSMGRAGRIRKRTCHISVTVDEK